MPWIFSKSIDKRWEDTYTFLTTRMAAAAGAEAGLALMVTHLRAMASTGEFDRLMNVMSLGFRWELIKDSAETRRRHYVRSVLLGYATLGDPEQNGKQLTVDEVSGKKADTEALSEIALDTLLRRMLLQSSSTEGTRTFVGLKTSLEKQNSIWALDQITEAISRAQLALGVMNRDANEATRFRLWFGTSDPKTVRSNFDAIYRGIQAGIMLIKDDDPAKDRVFGYVYPDGPNDPPRVYLCPAFWRAGKLSWQNVGGALLRKDNREANDNPLGVLVHELSHIFVRTLDHVYGQAKCKQLAIDNPGQALMNADNYEYYTESVMQSK